MGCYADIYAGKDRILVYKNVLPDFLTSVFDECDMICGYGKTASTIARRYELNELADWLGENESNKMILFVQKASVMKKRLAIYGYSEDFYVDQVRKALDEEKDFLEQLIKENQKDLEYLEILKGDLAELKDFRNRGDKNIDIVGRIRKIKDLDSDDVIDRIPDDIIFYGCIRNLKDDEYVILDYSDLEGGGYMDVSEFVLKDNNPIIIAEGVNDFNILRHSLDIIYPDLVDNITFLDTDGYKIEGGAGAVVKMIKSFAGAGIKNRILAILDNDTGALSAIQPIRNRSIKLPTNLKIAQYPNIEICKEYPTIGPQGEVFMDINGLAGSIEMYLGQEALTCSGELEKVMWTNYIEGVQKYQGELINKNEVNKRFKEIIKQVKNSEREYDFTDLKTLWDFIIHELSGIR